MPVGSAIAARLLQRPYRWIFPLRSRRRRHEVPQDVSAECRGRRAPYCLIWDTLASWPMACPSEGSALEGAPNAAGPTTTHGEGPMAGQPMHDALDGAIPVGLEERHFGDPGGVEGVHITPIRARAERTIVGHGDKPPERRLDGTRRVIGRVFCSLRLARCAG
jgi:hypothetical protein